MSIRNFWTHNWIDAVWLGIPLLMLISTAITVFMHSYSKLIAEVLQKKKKESQKQNHSISQSHTIEVEMWWNEMELMQTYG